jgi:predicted dehydrogenase/aryl-alcohol dehydrogenase-like predicted oxidoreductase
MATKTVRWGLLAAGGIANAFASALARTDSGKAVAVASRSLEKAKAFAKEFSIPKAYGSYEELLADPTVDAVYISTPHPMHSKWAIKAADAGKHILCEKPLAMNQYDVQAMIEAARRNDVFFMEAFMYRCNPQTQRLVEMIRSKAIGEVRIIRATFSFQCGYGNLDGRLMNPALGGGGIFDVGCYAVSMSRLIAGAALGKDFAHPIAVHGAGQLGKTGVDEWATALLKFEGGIVAQCATGIQLNQDNNVVIYGSEGVITVPAPWFCNGREPGKVSFTVVRYGKDPEEVVIDVPKGIYSIEADIVAANIKSRQAPSPAMTWADSLSQAVTLDAWRGALGLAYPADKLEAYSQPLDGGPLKVRKTNAMTYGRIPGVNKQISRLVMGTMVQQNPAHAASLFDEFYAQGGNCFDTAHIYAGGSTERLLGDWIKNRGLREKLVVIVKGAHPPACNPEMLVKQLDESLERLQLDYADMYLMHRDNTDIPVGEFVNVLNELKKAGRIHAFGGSNWTPARFDEANAYAKKNRMTPFAALSNNFSLARMVNPVWGGCVAASDQTIYKWHVKNQVPNFAWSSQARGFFAPGLAGPDKLADSHMVHCWYSSDNFKRLQRCNELAKKKGVHPMTIALAYVLAQPFPMWSLIGPASLEEGLPSYAALDLSLTKAEVKWLNLE